MNILSQPTALVLPNNANGWDHHVRELAAPTFKLELAGMEDRHHLTFDNYEKGKVTLDEYNAAMERI
jgi:hypothetical protein